MRYRAVLAVSVVAAAVLAGDQVLKAWARASLVPGREIIAIPGWLWFRLASNSGATLGLLSGHNLVFAGATLVIVAAVLVIAIRGYVPGPLALVALGAVAGGALGNLVDRVRLGAVTDFIELHLWPTDFNLADAAIRIGVALFLVALALDARRRRAALLRRHPAA